MDSIPVNIPVFGSREAELLSQCISTGWISSEGPFVKAFEDALSARVGRRYGVAVSNGTAALELAVSALGIGPGDEVILPSFTIISCASAIVRAGATPVVVDCDVDTWNVKPGAIAEAVTPRTRAIMVAHIYGLPVDMDPILELAKKHDLHVIEDSAEALGQTYKDRPCGSFGDLSTFSFYPNKLVTTGEGGMVVTNSEELAQRLRSGRNLAFLPERRFVHKELGWNYRLSNLQAAVGLAQLERLDVSVQRKREMGALYHQELADVDCIQLPTPTTSYARNIYWVFGVVMGPNSPLTASELAKALSDRLIGTRPFFWPMNEQPVLRDMGLFEGVSCPSAEYLGRNGLYLPSGLGTTDDQITRVSAAVREFLM